MPNIISTSSDKSPDTTPLPKQKPEERTTQKTTKEPVAAPKSMLKTLKMTTGKTTIIKTTREIVPLAKALEETTSPTPAPRKISIPAPAAYCDKTQQSAAENSASSGQPHTGTEENKGLADSLRLYMKAQKQDPALIDALYTAAQETGVSFELMIIKAMIESNLGANTIAAKSSARGMFQYIEPTWLSLIKRHGEKIGHASYANALEYDPSEKRYNPAQKSNVTLHEILALRDDALTASLIKAHQIIDEQSVLEGFKEGRAPTITDHYIMHMLGIPLSRTFYRLNNANSSIIPAHLKNGMFNQAIALNPGFFYDDSKNALTAPQIYQRFAQTTANKIEALQKIDKQYGSGENVMAQSCTPTPVRPRIHKPLASMYQNTESGSALADINPAAGEPKTNTAPLPPKHISTIALLRKEPTPLSEYQQDF